MLVNKKAPHGNFRLPSSYKLIIKLYKDITSCSRCVNTAYLANIDKISVLFVCVYTLEEPQIENIFKKRLTKFNLLSYGC